MLDAVVATGWKREEVDAATQGSYAFVLLLLQPAPLADNIPSDLLSTADRSGCCLQSAQAVATITNA